MPPSGNAGKKVPKLQVASEGTLLILSAVNSAADAFPPLKSAAGGALYILNLVKKFRSNKADWAAFGEYVQNAIAAVIRTLAKGSFNSQDELEHKLRDLRDALDDIAQQITQIQNASRAERIIAFFTDPDRITEMRTKLDGVLNVFKLEFTTSTALDVAEVLERIRLLRDSQTEMARDIVVSIDLSSLQYMEGASWKKSQACLGGTRSELIRSITDHLTLPVAETCASITLLSDVSGSGKSALSYSISEWCDNAGILASSFFFSRSAARTNPRQLITTLARDLAAQHKPLAERISSALEKEPSLPVSQSITRMFDKLILQPIKNATFPTPLRLMIVTIDGLDEADVDDDELHLILRNEVPKLPGFVRFFVTARPDEDVTHLASSDLAHIYVLSFDIHQDANILDISTYIRKRLRDITAKRSLGAQWPDEQTTARFLTKAEGLFIWAATICDYLAVAPYPDRKLTSLLSDSVPDGFVPQKKMDDLYSRILSACDWDDGDFTSDYHLVMGTLMAAQTPLSIQALESLHSSVPGLRVRESLSPLGSLLTGWTTPDRPVQILHESFREFVTLRAEPPIRINVSECSQRLALACLQVLNVGIPATSIAHLYNSKPGIPDLHELPAEHVLYACKYWQIHISDTEEPTPQHLEELRTFLTRFLHLWLMLLTSAERFQACSTVSQWIKESAADTTLNERILSRRFAHFLHGMSDRLTYCNRREEAFEAIQETVRIYRELVQIDSQSYIAGLSDALDALCICMLALGLREEAVAVMKESLTFLRPLAERNPAVYRPHLARSLNDLAVCLGDTMGRETTLDLLEEALTLRKQLVADYPDNLSFRGVVAMTQHNYAAALSKAGKRQQSLPVAEEAALGYERLEAQYPGRFKFALAQALVVYSNRLAECGIIQKSIETIQRAISLQEELNKDRPVIASIDISLALNNLSIRQANCGNKADALANAQRSLELRRVLAGRYPRAFSHSLLDSLVSVANRLHDLNRTEDALILLREGAALQVSLNPAQHGSVIPDLIASLCNLADRFSALGQHAEGVSVAQACAALSKNLFEKDPVAYAYEHSHALHTVFRGMLGARQEEGAIDVATTALKITEQYVHTRPVVFTAFRAGVLNDIGSLRFSHGNVTEALVHIEEAVTLRRKLHKNEPTSYRVELALSLANCAEMKLRAGRPDEALALTAECVSLRRQLAAEMNGTFHTVLSASLHSLATLHWIKGQYEESISVSKELVEYCKKYVSIEPAVVRPILANSMHDAGMNLSQRHHHTEALDYLESALNLRLEQYQKEPDELVQPLSMLLTVYTVALRRCGRNQDAVDAIKKFVDSCRASNRDEPVKIQQLALLLNSLSNTFSTNGSRREAFKAVQEAVSLQETLGARKVSLYLQSLNGIAVQTADSGDFKQALAIARRALGLLDQQADGEVEDSAYLRAQLHSNMSLFLRTMRRKEEAFSHSETALDLWRAWRSKSPGITSNVQFVHALIEIGIVIPDRQKALSYLQEALTIGGASSPPLDPTLARPIYTRALHCYAKVVLRKKGPQAVVLDEALEHVKKAIELWRELYSKIPDAFRDSLAESLRKLSDILALLGQKAEARVAAQEAVNLCQKTTDDDPTLFNPDLGRAKKHLALRLAELGKFKDALERMDKVISLYQELRVKNPEPYEHKLMTALNLRSQILRDQEVLNNRTKTAISSE